MLGLKLHQHAYEDLVEIKAADPDSAAYILAWIQEAESESQLLDDMLQLDEFKVRENDDWVFNFSTKPWHRERGRLLWRMRFLDLEDEGKSYRLILGFFPKRKRIYVLGVVARRDMDYDGVSDFRTRVCDDYDELA